MELTNLKRDFQLAKNRALAVLTKDLIDSLVAVTPIDTGAARAGWELEGSTIVNREAHLSDLNQGSSKQAPSHFVEAALLGHKHVRPSGTIVRNIK